MMMASVFLSRVVGLLREMAIAYMAGAGKEVDAYQIAFILPEILNHVVATGFLSVTFIPLFTRHLVRSTEAEAWRVFSIILCVFGSLALAVVAVSMTFAPQLVALAAQASRLRVRRASHPACPTAAGRRPNPQPETAALQGSWPPCACRGRSNLSMSFARRSASRRPGRAQLLYQDR